jgi:hypothetical protein
MSVIHGTSGAALPFFLDDFNHESLTTSFDPIGTKHDAEHVHPTEMTEQMIEAKYAKRGFLARPNTDGSLWVITWRQYQEAIHNKGLTIAQKRVILAALTPKEFLASANTWIETPLIKVFGTAGDGAGHYISASDEMNVGIIL